MGSDFPFGSKFFINFIFIIIIININVIKYNLLQLFR